MPALSPTMEEGVLSKWNVKVGDSVRSGDVIAEIETDKATMEVEAVDEGVVEAILVAAGTEGVKVNTVIARLKGEGEGAPSGAVEKREPPPQSAVPTAPPQAGERKRAESSPLPQSGGGGRVADGGGKPPQDGARVFATPLARRLAKDKGVELSALNGSGPHGRIIAVDIGAAQPGKSTVPTSGSAAPASVRTLAQMGIPDGSYDLEPLDGMRKTIARRMTESATTIPTFPLTIDLQIDRLLDARHRINTALTGRDIRVSVNDMIINAAAAALKASPAANASYTPEGIALHHHADIAVAVAVEHGLITPIIREAENRSLADIAVAMKDLAERARIKKLKPEEYQGGTFSISNLGMFGIREFGSIINEPQGCILSVGAGEKRPVVKNGELAVATVMTVTLTCDHRVVDGATGAKWLQAFRGFIEDPITLLA
ncbi:pyruvate dehydrogenase complex dihydrolipoamide acetyltransferase [soil metagenome]